MHESGEPTPVSSAGRSWAAQEDLDFLNRLSRSRELRQLAYTPDGEPACIHVPGHNPDGPCVGFIGVLPERRGRGYAYDLLVEYTHAPASAGAERISAATDRGNLPMAAHFARAGYPITQERINVV